MKEYESLIRLRRPPSIAAWSSIAGKKEGSGPMGQYFDMIEQDGHFGKTTWEQAESELQNRTLQLMLEKAGCKEDDISCIFAGDLINQCTSSTYALRHLDIPYLGIFGACATFAEGLILAAVTQSGMDLPRCAVLTSSHFSSAERQFRFPLSYGGQRTPNAQWTCTAAGAALLVPTGDPPYVRGICAGRIRDCGLTDASNMGAAMAPAAADTVARFFSATRTQLTAQNGYDLRSVHRDCGVMMFNRAEQDTHAGGSGCGCSASILCGYYLPRLQRGEFRNILYAATGALLSPMLCQQGESIPGICHAVHLSCESGKEQRS